jgi:hypothetical protein
MMSKKPVVFSYQRGRRDFNSSATIPDSWDKNTISPEGLLTAKPVAILAPETEQLEDWGNEKGAT